VKRIEAAGIRPAERLHDAFEERRTDPVGAQPGAFRRQVGDLIDGVDLTQGRAKFKAVENDNAVLKADMLWPQVSMSIDEEAGDRATP